MTEPISLRPALLRKPLPCGREDAFATLPAGQADGQAVITAHAGETDPTNGVPVVDLRHGLRAVAPQATTFGVAA